MLSITPDDIRTFANLPTEAPEELLNTHIKIAERDLVRASGVMDCPEGQQEYWLEALTVRALASAFPWLNTFVLDGAAQVGRLEGSLEYRFLDAEEINAKVKQLNTRFQELAADLARAADDGVGATDADGVWMAAI